MAHLGDHNVEMEAPLVSTGKTACQAWVGEHPLSDPNANAKIC
jgi:hypothetical protein